MHYRLCYTSIGQDLNIIAESGKKVKHQSLRIPNSRVGLSMMCYTLGKE